MNLTIDIEKFVNRFLPVFMRKPILKAYCKLLMYHIGDLFSITESHYQAKINELQTTIQTDVLQAKLRALYPDVGSYKVFVKTKHDEIPTFYTQLIGEHHKQEYIYKLSESSTPIYVQSLEEDLLTNDYTVIVPTTYIAQLNSIEFVVKKYRPAGKRILIIFQNITS